MAGFSDTMKADLNSIMSSGEAVTMIIINGGKPIPAIIDYTPDAETMPDITMPEAEIVVSRSDINDIQWHDIIEFDGKKFRGCRVTQRDNISITFTVGQKNNGSIN